MATAFSTCVQRHCATSRTHVAAFSYGSFVSKSFVISSFSHLPFRPSLSLKSPLLARPSLLICRNTSFTELPQETEADSGPSGGQPPPGSSDKEPDDGGGGAIGRLSTAFIFVFWAAFIAYCAFLAPNQTPVTDHYFLEKLLRLKGDDGFEMNRIISCLWCFMGLWPAIYCMLLIPTGRSLGKKIPIWPFTSLSLFAGAFALLPYFGLWQPPSPKVSNEEVQQWPLRILDSKIFAIVVAIAGVGLFGAAAAAGGEAWTEFRKFFNSSRFIHTMSLDFMALSFLAPFWVFNDMEMRKWSKKASWAPALAFLPFLGPALYLIIRPSLGQSEGE